MNEFLLAVELADYTDKVLMFSFNSSNLLAVILIQFIFLMQHALYGIDSKNSSFILKIITNYLHCPSFRIRIMKCE